MIKEFLHAKIIEHKHGEKFWTRTRSKYTDLFIYLYNFANEQTAHYIHKYRQFAGYTTACANYSGPLYKYDTTNNKTNNNARFYRTDYDTCYKTNI